MFEHYPLRFMFAFGLSIATAVGFAVAWYRTSRRLRELEDRVLPHGSPRAAQEPVMDAIDGLAARVDDIASGQEFLNRVLSEKLSRLSKGQPKREVTPV